MTKIKFAVLLILSLCILLIYHFVISIKKENNYAVIDFQVENFKEALSKFKGLIVKRNKNYILKFNYANAELKFGNYEKAAEIYEKLLQNNNIGIILKSEIYYNLGNIYFLEEDYEKALSYYKTL